MLPAVLIFVRKKLSVESVWLSAKQV